MGRMGRRGVGWRGRRGWRLRGRAVGRWLWGLVVVALMGGAVDAAGAGVLGVGEVGGLLGEVMPSKGGARRGGRFVRTIAADNSAGAAYLRPSIHRTASQPIGRSVVAMRALMTAPGRNG